jgi:aspartyl aminopeptidase
MTEEQFLTLKSRSFCISLDMAHGLHPLHSKKYDANHAPLLGGGIALKSHADLKYASSAKSLAKARSIAQRANIPLQHFCSRSDQLCGSTVGPLITSTTGIITVDLGVPQLSMHSSRELIATKDYVSLVSFLKETLQGCSCHATPSL